MSYGLRFYFNRHVIPMVFLAILAFGLYAPSLRNGFVYDDEITVVNNGMVTGTENLSRLFHRDYFYLSKEDTYRPAVTLSYFIDHAVYGMNPWGFHLTNILLHTLNGLLIYIFLALLKGNTDGSPFISLQFLSSLLFVVHPALTEAVEAISYREDLLAFFFCVGALDIYLFCKKRMESGTVKLFPWLAFSCMLYFLGLLSKEMSAVLPLIIFFSELTYREKGKNLFNRYTGLYLSGYTITTIFYLYLRFFLFINPSENAPVSWSLGERLLTIPVLIVNYLKLLLFPAALSPEYELSPVKSFLSVPFIFSFLAVTLMVVSAIRLRERMKDFSFGLGTFLIALLPVYNVVPLINPFAERYIYLPAIGIVIAVGSLIITASSSRHKRYVYAGFFLMVLSYSSITIDRHGVWKDSYELWLDAVRKTPESSRAHLNLGVVYEGRGMWNEAIREYEISLKLNDSFPDAFHNLGNVYQKTGKFNEAVESYRKALNLDRNRRDSHMELGFVYARMGKYEEAIKEFGVAIRLDPQGEITPLLHDNLGIIYLEMNRFKEAAAEFKTAAAKEPFNPDYHFHLGAAYDALGRITEARYEYEFALKLKPDHYMAARNLNAVNRNRQ